MVISFSQWSDGNTDNPRVISNVQSDLVVTAEFVEVVVVEYTVEFLAGFEWQYKWDIGSDD